MYYIRGGKVEEKEVWDWETWVAENQTVTAEKLQTAESAFENEEVAYQSSMQASDESKNEEPGSPRPLQARRLPNRLTNREFVKAQ